MRFEIHFSIRAPHSRREHRAVRGISIVKEITRLPNVYSFNKNATIVKQIPARFECYAEYTLQQISSSIRSHLLVLPTPKNPFIPKNHIPKISLAAAAITVIFSPINSSFRQRSLKVNDSRSNSSEEEFAKKKKRQFGEITSKGRNPPVVIRLEYFSFLTGEC